MSAYLRYIPDSPLGRKFPGIRYPARTNFPDRETAEIARQAMHNTEQLEIVEEE